MFEAIMMASTGLQNQQKRIDTIADNVSNSNTVGFKSVRLDFKDALYSAGGFGPASSLPDGNLQKGHGVMTAGVNKDFRDGALMTTNNQLDFALSGHGFFEIESPTGAALYTRAGNFYTTTVDNQLYLVDAHGYFVRDNQGGRIAIPDGTQTFQVSGTGEIDFVGSEGVLGTSKFGIFTFRNNTGLSAAGSGFYEETVASGEKMEATAISVSQGALEASGVDLASEMTRLIRAQRAFSLASRALTTADNMEGIANNLRK